MAQVETAVEIWNPDPKEFDIYRKHFAPEKTTDVEWDIFLATCRAYRVSPLRKQIYLVGRWDSQKNRMVHTPQVSIGTLRLLALRTREFEGTTEPEWGDEEGNYYKLWPKKLGNHPYAARIGVYRKGFRAPVWGVTYFHELAQKKSEKNGGGYTKFWNEMGIHMILKCAEAAALRGAFEEECGGIYLHEEMNQADSNTVVVSVVPEPAEDASDALKETANVVTERPVPVSPEPKPVTATQLNTIKVMASQVGENVAEMPTTYDGAKEVIAMLNEKKKALPKVPSVKPDVAPATPSQTKAVLEMIAKAKRRVEDLGLTWDTVKSTVLGGDIADSSLVVEQVAKINGAITKQENNKAS